MSLYGLLYLIISDSQNCSLIFLILCSTLLLKHSNHSLNLCITVTVQKKKSHSEDQEIFNLNGEIYKEKYILKLSQANSPYKLRKWKLGHIWHLTLNILLTLLLNFKGSLHTTDFKLQKNSSQRVSTHVYTTNLPLKSS